MARGTHESVPDSRNETVLVYLDGDFVPRDRATVSVFDSAFLVGDGVWEGFRLHHGEFVHLDRHLDRLFATARGVHLDIGKTREEIVDIIRETARVNGMETGVHMRLMVSRGRKKTPAQDPRLVVGGPTIVVIAEYKVADPDVTGSGIRLHTAVVRRPPPETLDQRWNCHSKIHEVAALAEALEAGADEALMLDVNGNVATCNATNFFIVTGGEVWTSTGDHCLNGVTRALVIELAAAEGITARETDFTLDRVYRADEAFVTGTFGGLTPVVTVDGRPIGKVEGAGPITARLSAAYRDAIDAAAAHS
jgi:branched-chain amino acid aminotransferase